MRTTWYRSERVSQGPRELPGRPGLARAGSRRGGRARGRSLHPHKDPDSRRLSLPSAHMGCSASFRLSVRRGQSVDIDLTVLGLGCPSHVPAGGSVARACKRRRELHPFARETGYCCRHWTPGVSDGVSEPRALHPWPDPPAQVSNSLRGHWRHRVWPQPQAPSAWRFAPRALAA